MGDPILRKSKSLENICIVRNEEDWREGAAGDWKQLQIITTELLNCMRLFEKLKHRKTEETVWEIRTLVVDLTEDLLALATRASFKTVKGFHK